MIRNDLELNDNFDTEAEQESDSETPKMRVGKEYQAEIPQFVGHTAVRSRGDASLSVTKVWSPTDTLTDSDLDTYLQLAREKHGYSAEQAMGMLFWHNYDLEAASKDLRNFTPFPDEMSLEDKVIFEQAFQSHGKSFRRIHSMLPDKSVGSLVRYYYSWKKTRCRTSHIGRQARHFARSRNLPADSASSDDEIAANNSDDSDFDPSRANSQPSKAKIHHNTNSLSSTERSKSRARAPKGIYLDTDALVELTKEHKTCSYIDNDILKLRRSIQQNKQQLSEAEGHLQRRVPKVEQLRPSELRQAAPCWTSEEMAAAGKSCRKQGNKKNAKGGQCQSVL